MYHKHISLHKDIAFPDQLLPLTSMAGLQQLVILSGQPAATGYPFQQLIKTPWSSGLCDCCSDVPNCCMTCFCPCITFGQIAEIVDEGSTFKVVNGGEICVAACGVSGALYAALTWLTCCGCMYSCCYRSKMRAKYNLHESPCNDCCVHYWCEPCALCQEYRELQNKGFNMSLGWQGNIDRQNRGSLTLAIGPTALVMQTGMMR